MILSQMLEAQPRLWVIRMVEEGTTEEIFYEPRHPYTMGLLNSIPKVTGEESKQRLIPILGTPPDMLNPPTGCPFYPRCQFAMKACASMQVPEQYLSETHRAVSYTHLDVYKRQGLAGVDLKEHIKFSFLPLWALSVVMMLFAIIVGII